MDAISSPAERAFRSELKEYLAQLPKQSAVRAHVNASNSEFIPKEIMDSSRLFGVVRDKLLKNPELVPAGLDFYGQCAKDSDLVLQVRAVCLRNFYDWSSHAELRDVDPQVVKLANQIPAVKMR